MFLRAPPSSVQWKEPYVTEMPSCCINHAEHSAKLATGVATPLSGCAGLSPRESVSHDSQVALLPYESCSLATPSGGQNKPLCAPLQSHVAQPPKGVLLFHRTKGAAPWFFQLPATRPSRFQPLRPADWYLLTDASPSTLTEILRCRSG